MVHTEVVLQGDGCKGLRSGLDLDPLLSLDSLVQTVRVATAIHETTSLLIDDHHLIVYHHILIITLEEGVSLKELIDRVDTLALNRIVGD